MDGFIVGIFFLREFSECFLHLMSIEACRSLIHSLFKIRSEFYELIPTFRKFEFIFFLIKLLEIFCALESFSFLGIGRHDEFVQEKGLLESKAFEISVSKQMLRIEY